MNYGLNSYAVVEDAVGLHLIPSYRRAQFATVLLDSTALPLAAQYLAAYAEARGLCFDHSRAHIYALEMIKGQR